MTIHVYDPTLRDGNHAVKHTLSLRDVAAYCAAIDGCGLDVVEVGHGNGLGASSLQLGFAAHGDAALLACAREHLVSTRLGVHVIPGFATLDDLAMAIDVGVDVVRIAAHCTEADITTRYIECAKTAGLAVQGVLMMSHMASSVTLLAQARLQQAAGADAIILMDSAGAYVESDVVDKVGRLVQELAIPVGFHAHNNLGMAVANTVTAVKSGARWVDATLNGFGAGAGNTSLQVLIGAFKRARIGTRVDLGKLLDASDAIAACIALHAPQIKHANILSGVFGVFSGFEQPVARAARFYGVSEARIYEELARRNVVAGQEDLIVEVAQTCARQ